MSENSSAPAKQRFTLAELQRCDGSDPALPTLIAYTGRVYDVSRSYPWARGRHWGDHRAGQDQSGQMDPRIHGPEMLARVPCVGALEDGPALAVLMMRALESARGSGAWEKTMDSVETVYDVHEDHATLVRDGIVGLKGAFSRDFAEAMRDDMMTAFSDAIQRPGGAIGRGPRRWYVEIHPQMFSGFVELCSHPWVVAMCEATLGPDYRIVEIGFDTPFQGAMSQPWHRDFPSPPDTWRDRRITSLAFNLTGVDVTQDMGPFEIAIGTQWDDGRAWKHEMFPPEELWPRFAAQAVRKYPQAGDISCRSALTVHRGTAHGSPVARPVMVLGVDAPGAGHDKLHDLMVTQDYYDALPPVVRDRLVCRVVDKLQPVTQKHDIEGLAMGVP